MLRRSVLLTVGLLCICGLAVAGGHKVKTKVASGTVKAISAESLTIQQGSVELSFLVGEDTKVVAKGASTKTREARKEGKSLTIKDLIQSDQRVMVRYHEEEGGKLRAVEVRRLS